MSRFFFIGGIIMRDEPKEKIMTDKLKPCSECDWDVIVSNDPDAIVDGKVKCEVCRGEFDHD